MIHCISFRTGWGGRQILQVTVDHDFGYDCYGIPHSLSNKQTRDATPNDLIELSRLGYFNPNLK